MTAINVSIPTVASKLRIKHFAAMQHVPIDGFNNDKDRIAFLAKFTGLRYGQVLDFTPVQIQRMTEHAMQAISTLDLISALPEAIELEGTTYKLVDPDKVGIGWHIDFSSCDIAKDPVKLACLFYLQEGYNYSDVDENGNIKFPIDSRYDLFAKSFELSLFMRCASFFLRKSLSLTSELMVQNLKSKKASERISFLIKVLNPSNGRRASKQ
jgi:hypothetical protein